MIRAREYLDANSMIQQCFEQDLLMHLQGLQIQASEIWGPGRVTFMNNLLLNSYDPSYQLQLILGPPQSFENDSKLNTKQIAQIAKLLRALPSKDISIRLDLGNTNNRVFLRILKSTLRKLRVMSKITFKPFECQGSTWLEVLSTLRKTQPSKVSFQIINSQFYMDKEKMRNVLFPLLKQAEEFSFYAFPLKVTNRISWFADSQRMMDIFKNLRRIHVDPFDLEEAYYYCYQRLFKTMANLKDVSLVCHNRYFFRQTDTSLTFPAGLKRLKLFFLSLWDKEAMKNIFNSILTKQKELLDLEELEIAIKYLPTPMMIQAPPILSEYAFLQNLTCPNLKSLKLHLDLVRKVSLAGLEKLSKLETFDLTLGRNLEKIMLPENQSFPENIKRFKFHYDPEKSLSEYKTQIYHSFIAFLTKHLKDPGATLANSLSELHLNEANVNSEVVKVICLSSLETLRFQNCILSEKELTKLLNSERLTSLRSLHVQSSLLKDKSIVNERLFQIIVESSRGNQIEELSIERMDFNDGGLENVQLAGGRLPKLKRLSLFHNTKLTFRGLTKILQIDMPRLEYLNIENFRCPYLPLQKLLLERVPNIKELKLDAGRFQIDETPTLMEFKTNFLKATNYGIFKSRI